MSFIPSITVSIATNPTPSQKQQVPSTATWVNAAIEPMSYGFAGMKFVKFE